MEALRGEVQNKYLAFCMILLQILVHEMHAFIYDVCVNQACLLVFKICAVS